MIPDAAVEAAVSAYNDLTGNLFESDYVRETMRTVIEAAAPHMLAEDPRIDAIARWCGRHRSGYYDEAQDDVVALLRATK